MSILTKLNILGMNFICGNSEDVIKYLLDLEKTVLYSGNGEILNNIIFKRTHIIKDSYFIPDGESAVMLLRRLSNLRVDKLAGIDIMNYIIENYKDKKIYLFGATEEVNNTLQNKLKDRGVNIVGGRSGYGYSNSEVVDDVNNSEAEILFIALGSPLQEEFIYKEFNRLNARLIIPVGGAFDVIAGYKKRAPKLFIKLKLEWLWRAILEPKRFNKIFNIINFNIHMILFSRRLRRYSAFINELSFSELNTNE